MRKPNMRHFMLLTAFAAAIPCAANEIGLSITNSLDVQDAYIVYSVCQANFTSCQAVNVLHEGFQPAATYAVPITVPASTQSAFVSAFGLVGSSVVVGLNNTTAASDVGNPWPFSTPESTVASDLSGGNTTDLKTFFSNNLSSWDNPSTNNLSGGKLVEFSNGTLVGSIDAIVTPEPSSVWLCALVLMGILVRRFRLEKAR
jgi:hypothetical protein